MVASLRLPAEGTFHYSDGSPQADRGSDPPLRRHSITRYDVYARERCVGNRSWPGQFIFFDSIQVSVRLGVRDPM